MKVLEQADPDLIALQENARRPGAPERSHAHQLGRALGMSVVEGAFHREMDYQGRSYEAGVALLSHLPIDEVAEADLPYRAEDGIGGSPRLLQARLDLEGSPLHVWVTHLPSKDGSVALECARTIVRLAGAASAEDLLLCGDLNSEPETDTLRCLAHGSPAPEGPIRPMSGDHSPDTGCRTPREGSNFIDLWAALHPGDTGWTAWTPDLSARLDYVLLRPSPSGLRAHDAGIIGAEPDAEGFYPSDHCGLRTLLRR